MTTHAGHWLAVGVPTGTWIDWRYRPEDDRLADGGVEEPCVRRRVRVTQSGISPLDHDLTVLAHAAHAHRHVTPESGRASGVHCSGSVSATQVMSEVALAV